MNSIKDFFFLNLNQYENFAVSFPVGIFLIFITVALCAASFIVNYQKHYTLAILKQLTRHNATDEKSAKTLGEVHLEKSFGLKYSLQRSNSMKSMVKRVGEKIPTYEEFVENSKKKGYKEEKIDFESARFYIDAGAQEKIQRIMQEPAPAWWRPVLMSLFFISLAVIIGVFLPELLSWINNTVADK